MWAGTAVQRDAAGGGARRIAVVVPIVLFLIAFAAVPLLQFKGLQFIPGDIGDGRLNNYFLENIWRFLSGRASSLWNLDFFYPFPFVGGFSDNLFGSAPPYLVARALGAAPDTAFQIWYLAGYAFNYAAAYWGLRRLDIGPIGAAVGALVFAFSLPTTAFAPHAQLHYRFGLPLASAFFLLFLRQGRWRLLLAAGTWMAWQFYCSIYLGFFGLMLLVSAAILFFVFEFFSRRRPLRTLVIRSAASWAETPGLAKAGLLAGALALALAMGLLFYPYILVQHLYGATRAWEEISDLLPTPESYILSDASRIWAPHDALLFSGMPAREEHNLFFGLVPLLLALAGAVIGLRSGRRRASVVIMAGTFVAIVLMTLEVDTFSLWRLVYRLPLASAIRAVARIDLALLLPLAYLGGVAVEELWRRRTWVARAMAVLAVALLALEFSLVDMRGSLKTDWRLRLAAKEAMVPANLPSDAILFFAQTAGPDYGDEVDAMWLANERGLKTLNGYSGIMPPGERPDFGRDCAEGSRRISSYLDFIRQPHAGPAYARLAARLAPVGFPACGPGLRKAVGLR